VKEIHGYRPSSGSGSSVRTAAEELPGSGRDCRGGGRPPQGLDQAGRGGPPSPASEARGEPPRPASAGGNSEPTTNSRKHRETDHAGRTNEDWADHFDERRSGPQAATGGIHGSGSRPVLKGSPTSGGTSSGTRRPPTSSAPPTSTCWAWTSGSELPLHQLHRLLRRQHPHVFVPSESPTRSSPASRTSTTTSWSTRRWWTSSSAGTGGARRSSSSSTRRPKALRGAGAGGLLPARRAAPRGGRQDLGHPDRGSGRRTLGAQRPEPR
jgi:hypothetical protein